IPWSEDPATFVVNALAPAEVVKVVIDEDDHRIEVVVPDEQLSLAIGRRGQNVRLASQLTGWAIDIMTEAEESERRQEELRQRSQMFIEALDVDDVIAHLLVGEGFTSIDDLVYVPIEEIASIEGFDEEVAEELRRRAQEYLAREHTRLTERRLELGVSDELASVEGLTPAMLVQLGEAGVKTLDDLADLSSDELRYITGSETPVTVDEIAALDASELAKGTAASPLSHEEADAIIMSARSHWFEGEDGEQPLMAGGAASE